MRELIFAILLFMSSTAEAQFKKPFFSTLNVASGLPEAYVRVSFQDKYGYIWMGTQNGLVRYDGYKIKPYTLPDDIGDEIVNASIEYIYEDGQGKLWILIRSEGFYYYDRTRDLFVKQLWNDKKIDSLVKKVSTVFYWKEDRQPKVYWIGVQQYLEKIPFKILCFNAERNSMEEFSAGGKGNFYIPAHRTIDIRQDANGKIWLISDSLLSYFDNSSRSFKPWFVLPENIYGDFFEAFQPDPADTAILWMNTYDPARASNPKLEPHVMKLFRFNIKTKEYRTFFPDVKIQGALPASGLQIYTDSLRRIWVSTDRGLSLYNRQNGTFTNYPLSFADRNGLYVLTADKAGNLWIGGNFEGLHYLNIESGVVTACRGNNEEGDLPENATINQLGYDRSGTLWVSTPFGGISYLNRQKSLFAPIPVTPALFPAAESMKPSTFTICGSQGDSICFMYDTASLYAWHSRTNRYDKIDLKSKRAYTGIVRVVSGTDGTLWIAITGQGLYNYNPKTKTSINYTKEPNDSLSLNNIINNLATDKAGVLWIGTSVRGLFSFNKTTGKFTHYPFLLNDGTRKANNELDDRTVICMFFDSDGILWIGTNLGGLNRFDTRAGKFTSYLNRKKGFNCVVSIFEDSQKRLWAGTYLSGLYLFDRKTESYNRYSEKEGLLGNHSAIISEDNAGNIWSFSERGMSRLNPANNTITNFTEFKIESRAFYIYKDAEGNFNFATKEGMVSFNPLQLNDNRIPPAVIIESVSYHVANAVTLADTVLFTEGRQEIRLAYNENKVVFQYVALHFADAVNNQYAYQLAGHDEDWVQAGTQRIATYTNLSPGTYTFKVKAANSDGVWNERGASFVITILPPWWKTWWAYLLYAILFGGAISGFIAYRSAALKNENKILEEKVALRTAQLQSSLADLKSTQSQLIQSEKMASLGELTAGIAHEIQNPLNFVNNFGEVSNELMDEMKEEFRKGDMEAGIALAEDVKLNLEKIIHHGKRADSIVKGMLQHSRGSNGIKQPTDVNALAEEFLRLSYHGLRAKDNSFNAGFITDFDPNLPKINLLPQDIGRVLLNLFNNAFYACTEKLLMKQAETGRSAEGENQTLHQENFEPMVSVSTRMLPNGVEIVVKDNGNGIPVAIIDKIFQPFFTTKPTGQGTGLGLSLSYDIVKAHGGELKVESVSGNGSAFTIVLPI